MKTGLHQILLCIVAFLASCTATRQSESQFSFEIEGSNEYESQAKPAKKPSKKELVEKGLKVQHPKEATAWYTRKLIMIQQQPPKESILECKTTVESLSKEADSLQLLDEAAVNMKWHLTSAAKTYHWCFYQLMADLDLKLEKDLPLLQEKKELFLSKMRSLWIMARALDANSTSSENTYMIYLRKRYLDISQHEFGRNLEVIDKDNLLVTAGKSGKSAAEFADP